MNSSTRLPRLRSLIAISIAIILSATFHSAGASTRRKAATPGNVPPTVRITCPIPSPLVVPHVIPSVRIHWEGHDPDGPGAGLPVEYKFILLGPGSEFPFALAVTNPDSLRRYYANHPLGPWAGWDSTGPNQPSAAFNNLIPGADYLFAVIAFDVAGDYSPVFTLSSNMLRFAVGFAGYSGPVITLSGPGLDYRYPTGGYCACPSAEVPVDVPEHRSTTFRWSAQVFTACDTDSVRAYRWALDITDVTDQTPRTNEQTDLAHWSTPSPLTRSATLPPFVLSNPPTTEEHRLYVEALDDVGLRSLGIIRITVVPSTNQPPDCSTALADPAVLWPPNHQLVPIHITGLVDPDGDPLTVQVTGVTQDEGPQDRRSDPPISSEGLDANSEVGAAIGDASDLADAAATGGPHHDQDCADAVIESDGTVKMRAERNGGGNGRVYVVSFTATDVAGASCSGSVRVCVPHDRRHPSCADDGQRFNSLVLCDSRRHDGASYTMLEVRTPTASHGENVASLEYSLPIAENVLVAVYDVTGRRVETLVNEYQFAGTHAATWHHASAAQGIYFVRLWTKSASIARTISILR